MNEDRFGARIHGLLDQSVAGLDDAKLARLRAARERALAVHRVPALAAAPAGGASLFGPLLGSAPWWMLPVALAILLMIGVHYWQTSPNLSDELADVDAAVLKSDLPIDAYLDQGFKSWLKRSND